MAEEPPQGPQGVMLNEEGFRNFLQEITDQYYIDVELSDSFYNFFYPLIETAALEGSTPEEIERLIIKCYIVHSHVASHVIVINWN